MAVVGPRAVILVFFTAYVSGCSLSVDYEGSSYSCDPPDGECPSGYTCGLDGVCRPVAGAADAALVDGPFVPTPDAPVIDGGFDAPPQAITVTFGERLTSQIKGVTRDTQIDSNNPNGNFGANAEFFCDQEVDVDGNLTRTVTGLIRFDLSAIPQGATVLSASLELVTGNDPLDVDDNAFAQLHAVLEDWDEGNSQNGAAGTANFNQRKPGTAWANAGARTPSSSSPLVLASVAATTANTAFDFDLPVSLVQSWVDAPATNFGLSCFVAPAGVDSDVGFKTRHTDQDGREPQLTITYIP